MIHRDFDVQKGPLVTTPTRPRAYVPLRSGPRLDEAWTVTVGIVAVTGENGTITLPPGATWPGVQALPDDWLDDLQPFEAVSSPGSQWRTAQPADLPAGVALIHAQMLRSGPLTVRLTRLDQIGAGGINQSVQAAAVGAGRESVSKVRCQMDRT